MKKLLHLSFLLLPFVQAKAQTTCATAQVLTVNGGCLSGTVTDATVTTNGYTCGGTIYREYWLSFTLNSSSTINITSTCSNRDLALQLFSGTCASLTQLACANAFSNNGGQTETISNQSLAGGTYYVKILNVGSNHDIPISSFCVTSVPNCDDALQLCSDVSFNGNSLGHAMQELNSGNRGCLNDNEHQSSWFFFTPSTSGTIAMTISTTVDYDFAIWTTGNCGSLGTPTRCSYSAITGSTGMAATVWGQISALGCGTLGLYPCYGNVPVIDISEGSGGDKWVAPLDITSGETYIMVIDNYTADGTSYSISFTLTNGATLNCTPIALPVEISSFSGEYRQQFNVLNWTLESELNNDYFTIERSNDAVHWTFVTEVKANESSFGHKEYSALDKDFPRDAVNYYRLRQTDKNGKTSIYMHQVSIDNRLENMPIERVVNIMGQTVDINTPGVVIIQYQDGAIVRRFNN